MSIKAGATSQTIPIFISDTSGNPLTGLVHNTASLTCYYARPGAAAVAVTLATQTVAGAWASGGFKEIDAANMPGWYRLDLPNAAIASGVPFVGVHLKGAASMAPLPLKIDLVAYDPQDATDLGLTNLDATVSSRAATADVDVTPFAVLGLYAKISGQEDDYIPVVSGDDKTVAIFFRDGSENPAPVPSGATAALLDSAGSSVGTATITESTISIGYLLVRLQVPSSGNPPSKLRLTFAGGNGAAWKHDVPVRAWS